MSRQPPPQQQSPGSALVVDFVKELVECRQATEALCERIDNLDETIGELIQALVAMGEALQSPSIANVLGQFFGGK